MQFTGGSWGAGPPDVMYSLSGWTDDDCGGKGGVEVYMLNRTNNDAGFCQVLDDSARWTEWKSMLKWAIVSEYVPDGKS